MKIRSNEISLHAGYLGFSTIVAQDGSSWGGRNFTLLHGCLDLHRWRGEEEVQTSSASSYQVPGSLSFKCKCASWIWGKCAKLAPDGRFQYQRPPGPPGRGRARPGSRQQTAGWQWPLQMWGRLQRIQWATISWPQQNQLSQQSSSEVFWLQRFFPFIRDYFFFGSWPHDMVKIIRLKLSFIEWASWSQSCWNLDPPGAPCGSQTYVNVTYAPVN